ncbi:21765_t:CDS:2 [Rhizophagus irregularis]|nr:21765_t:CDS:2 [Rhizophagus irregularis]
MTKDSQRQLEDEERVYLSNFGVNVVKLRTSLHGILESCELMEESKLNEVQAEFVKRLWNFFNKYYVEDPINQKKLSEKDNDIKIVNRNNKKKKEQKERIDLVKLLEVSEACFIGQQMFTDIYNNKIAIL